MPLSVQKTNFSGLVKKNLRCINHLSYGVVHSINGPADHPGEEVAGVPEFVRQTVDLKVRTAKFEFWRHWMREIKVARWQNWIPSFPWIAPGPGGGRRVQSKESKESHFAA